MIETPSQNSQDEPERSHEEAETEPSYGERVKSSFNPENSGPRLFIQYLRNQSDLIKSSPYFKEAAVIMDELHNQYQTITGKVIDPTQLAAATLVAAVMAFTVMCLYVPWEIRALTAVACYFTQVPTSITGIFVVSTMLRMLGSRKVYKSTSDYASGLAILGVVASAALAFSGLAPPTISITVLVCSLLFLLLTAGIRASNHSAAAASNMIIISSAVIVLACLYMVTSNAVELRVAFNCRDFAGNENYYQRCRSAYHKRIKYDLDSLDFMPARPNSINFAEFMPALSLTIDSGWSSIITFFMCALVFAMGIFPTLSSIHGLTERRRGFTERCAEDAGTIKDAKPSESDWARNVIVFSKPMFMVPVACCVVVCFVNTTTGVFLIISHVLGWALAQLLFVVTMKKAYYNQGCQLADVKHTLVNKDATLQLKQIPDDTKNQFLVTLHILGALSMAGQLAMLMPITYTIMITLALMAFLIKHPERAPDRVRLQYAIAAYSMGGLLGFGVCVAFNWIYYQELGEYDPSSAVFDKSLYESVIKQVTPANLQGQRGDHDPP